MANINHKPSKLVLNLLHVLPSFVEGKGDVVNTIIEINSGSINKYELITESGQLKLDRVGYSSLAYPFAYGAIPQTWDYDGDPLDIEIVNVIEPLVPGCVVEARIIGVMKFEDGGEVDDKIIAVLSDDRRSEHIKSVDDLGEQFKKESTYFWEHIKYLKKPGTGVTKGFFDKTEAIKVINECGERYKDIYLKKFD
ncbi:inorganic pyrophosphatase [Candidatus Nomurabacteria bacterium RIFCSPLOWO2_01_FULL_39_18]|uniref:inorganic diphosphatase n=1 Tax=Candidatus Nomurabacteria bacterium RIFCSPHIGHO2_01_FULL_40_24b TaxID=1801739 RepID=A0A1F6V731_9BACT|nr:MAG: inorganic pyrophosphatase [Candidatus Nomurabacteria bacterium RIFCSPHIGHO2_01_FULL_40_24b]OGI89111.1 MAG: inorganic pyrophosphatase [Candidatus Nomurabacteria bacterium RIFCSPLOWO2_01_FULL_39_18]